MIPSLIIIGMGIDPLKILILSQVSLSFQLPFAMIPLVLFTNNARIMGEFTNTRLTKILAWLTTAIILGLNMVLLYQILRAVDYIDFLLFPWENYNRSISDILDNVTMFKISEFSRFTRVSVKMLRHYDELGLLKPASIDPYTGYRYYSSDQLPRLNRVIALKDLGFSLEQIGKLLAEDVSPQEIRGMFRQRRLEIEEQLKAEQARLTLVENRLRVLEQNPRHPQYDVIIRQVGPQLVASIRQTVPELSQHVHHLFEEFEAYVARFQARAPSSPLTSTMIPSIAKKGRPKSQCQ
jgi:DNA-binding transcriptional MerR regulator